MTASILRYETEDGRSFFITPRSDRLEVMELGHRELLRAVQNDDPVTLQIRNVNITPGNMEDGLPRTASLSIKLKPIYGLIDGGWLPMPWANKDIAFLDSNMIIAVEGLISGHTQAPEAIKEFLGIDVQKVSSILYALEGVHRRPVTEIEFNRELDRAEQALSSVLPMEKIQFLDQSQRAGIYDILRHQSRDAAAKFLKLLVPKIINQVSKKEQRKIEKEILEEACKNNIPVDSFVVIALLSCVYDGGQKCNHKVVTPGRAVIKPKPNYDESSAYNAITDLFMLNCLHSIQALFPERSIVFYTQDVGLASLWVAMQPCQRIAKPNSVGQYKTTVTFPLDGGLFPALSPDETLELKHRLLDFSKH